MTSLMMGILTSCATEVVLDDLDYPLVDVQNSVNLVFKHTLTRDPENPRLYISQPFRPTLNKGFEAPIDEDQVRAVSHIWVVGNERPYAVKLITTLEKKTSRGWTPSSEDKDLSKRLSSKILEVLKRSRDQNFLDHYRPF